MPDAPAQAHDHSGGILTESMVAGAIEGGAHAGHGAHAGQPDAHAGHAPAASGAHGRQDAHAGHSANHSAGHVDHTGHELMFRNRFWVSLLLTLPVLLYSHMLQMWFGFTAPSFPGSEWIAPLFAFIIFVCGGVPFIQMAGPELRAAKSGMMTLISLAIIVAFVYSVAALWIDPAGGFFWEMALLIDVMLLGHWHCRWQWHGCGCRIGRYYPDHLTNKRLVSCLVQFFALSTRLWGTDGMDSLQSSRICNKV
jgi:cation transport ATPase